MDDDVFQWLRGVASGSWASPMLITTNGIARRHERAGHAERLFAHSTARTMNFAWRSTCIRCSDGVQVDEKRCARAASIVDGDHRDAGTSAPGRELAVEVARIDRRRVPGLGPYRNSRGQGPPSGVRAFIAPFHPYPNPDSHGSPGPASAAAGAAADAASATATTGGRFMAGGGGSRRKPRRDLGVVGEAPVVRRDG